jgi:hypothetical protein
MKKKFLKELIKQNGQIIDLLSDIKKQQESNLTKLLKKFEEKSYDRQVDRPRHHHIRHDDTLSED